MSAPLGGLRWRVSVTVLVVTAVLYSALAVLLFLVVVDTGRDAVRQRVDAVLDSMEAELAVGTATVRVESADGIVGELRRPGDTPEERAGELVVIRTLTVGGAEVSLVGTASLAALNESLRPLHRALWLGVPLAALFTAAVAGVATSRTLRPVDSITRLASRIGPRAAERVPVPDTGDEIERLAVTVNEMLERIAEGRRSMERFTSDSSHELRTPLMALQGEIELASRGLTDDGTFERMARQAARLAELVDALVLLSTLDEGRPPSLTRFDLVEAVRSEADVAAPHAVVSGAPVEIDADRELIGRAVRNLLTNARRHSVEHIEVTVDAEPGAVVIHVDDDGAGLDPATAEHVFERFRRLDEARSADGGGAGLGLAIVASVMRAHGGGVDVSRSPLGGARFTLRFPR